MPERGYQGWKNYATWAMNLWIDNTKEVYGAAREVMSEAARPYRDARLRASYAGEALRDWIDEDRPELPGPWVEMLEAGWDMVDWTEIAGHHLGEMGELEGRKEWRPRRRST